MSAPSDEAILLACACRPSGEKFVADEIRGQLKSWGVEGLTAQYVAARLRPLRREHLIEARVDWSGGWHWYRLTTTGRDRLRRYLHKTRLEVTRPR